MSETKRLFLLRHAKSSWSEPTLADHDRPLAPRGRAAAKRIGRHLSHNQTMISLVLCSSARRARETLELIQASGETRIEPELYGASADKLLNRLRGIGEEVDTVMLVGHNPAMQDLAVGLIGPASELATKKFPTAALASLTFAGPWRELEWGDAALAAFTTPKQLR